MQMPTHEIVAWAAFAASIIIPLTLANIASKRHAKKRAKLRKKSQPQTLLGVVQPPNKTKDNK